MDPLPLKLKDASFISRIKSQGLVFKLYVQQTAITDILRMFDQDGITGPPISVEKDSG
jgi:hypothetical protein